MGIGCGWLDFDSPAKVSDGFVDASKAQQCGAEITVSIHGSGLEFQCFPKSNRRLRRAAFLIEKISEIDLSHGSTWIFRERGSPERFHVPIHMALLPGQH